MGTISLKGDGPWRGKTTLNVADTGQSRHIKLENCYVNSDGSEIRHCFGLRSLLVLSAENPNGYARYTIDAFKPIFSTTPSAPYQYRYQFDTPVSLSLLSKAEPTHIHCGEQIADEVVIIGESGPRKSPIYDSGRNKLTIVSVTTVAGAFVLTLSGTPAARTADDASGPGLNGLRNDNVVLIDTVVVADPTAQAIIDARLNNRVHAINGAGTSGTTVVLTTTSGGMGGPFAASSGEIHVVRNNPSNSGYSPDGIALYDPDPLKRVDDPDALTAWRVVDRLDPSNVGRECFPAWVANRQRDFADDRGTGIGEGHLFTASPLCSRGVSRRFQRELPYRVQAEPATNRIILAAAGYGCLFDVPVKVTDDPLNIIALALGSSYRNRNNEHYRPRALGIPKAQMLECVNKTPPATAAQDQVSGFDFMVAVKDSSHQNLGLSPGVWQVGITYEDDALGIEGVGSEIVEVTIPNDPNRAFTIRIPFVHPGYLMGETLANKVSVYLAPPAAQSLFYYASFHLSRLPKTGPDVNGTNKDLSAVYGFQTGDGVANAVQMLIRTILLPMPATGESVQTVLDANRPFPIGRNAMPRGGQAARYVRGVLLSGGHIGNAGISRELWQSKASHGYNGPGTAFPEKNEVDIRERGPTMLFPDGANTDGTIDDHTLGIAGRCFPSGYQGIDFIHRALLPSGREYHTIDQVVNRKAVTIDSTFAFIERMRLTRDVVARTAAFGVTPSISAISKPNEYIWYLLPRDQVEIADPGLPTSSSKTNIKFADPKRGDTLTAVGEVAGFGILCSRKETASFAWNRNPGSEEPHTLSNEFGCVAPGSMVEFDGGCAWISDRGPVAYGGAGLQFIGDDIADDFVGRYRRYEFDEYGMMRCCWGAHDKNRGLVLWGLVSRPNSDLAVTSKLQPVAWANADDKLKSRFPCNEVLIWSYRNNVFSTWRPPSGLEILCVRPWRIFDGTVQMVACCADKNWYLMTDEGQEVNDIPFEFVLQDRGVATQTVSWTSATGPTTGTSIAQRNTGAGFLRTGQLVHVLNANKELVAETTVSQLTAVGASTTISLNSPVSWEQGYTLRIGARRNMVIVSTFKGGEKTQDIDIRRVRMRYTLGGGQSSNFGTANAKATALKTTRDENGPSATPKALSDPTRWNMLGNSTAPPPAANQPRDETLSLARTTMFQEGSAQAPEIAVKIEIAGSAQVRVADILLEVQ